MINRCICHNCSFLEIVKMKEQGSSLDEIIDKTQCGCSCGLCHPYILKSYESGQTEYKRPMDRTGINQELPQKWQKGKSD